jgi:hypothetical protein
VLGACRVAQIYPFSFASGIYPDPAHCILELVQNADDCKYDPSVQPTLHFALDEKCIVTTCNELGFTEKDVDALCGICNSSKKGHAGFIGVHLFRVNISTRIDLISGEMGIGMFSITSCYSVLHNYF